MINWSQKPAILESQMGLALESPRLMMPVPTEMFNDAPPLSTNRIKTTAERRDSLGNTMSGKRCKPELDAESTLCLFDRIERLREHLTQHKQSEVTELILDMATEDMDLLDRFEIRFLRTETVNELASSTAKAINVATKIDEKRLNHNFRYDHGAYEIIRRNLEKLVGLDAFDLALGLSVDLMRKGTHQMNMSDEGLMVEEIEDCIKPVIRVVASSDLDSGKRIQWCHAMIAADNTGGYVCEREFKRFLETIKADAN